MAVTYSAARTSTRLRIATDSGERESAAFLVDCALRTFVRSLLPTAIVRWRRIRWGTLVPNAFIVPTLEEA